MIPFALILISALLIPGLINKTRAKLAGRKGVPFFQPLLSVRVLLRKGTISSTLATRLTDIAPSVYLGVVLVAALFLPLGSYRGLLSFNGDFIVFCYLLGLGRLMLVLTALESGSSFEGMGAAREVLFSMLVEPCFFLLTGTLALVTGCWSFAGIFAAFDNHSMEFMVLSVILGYAFFNVALAENGRLPVDDPRTHLELTMIHEAMILDLSGIDLAYIQIAGWVKLALYGMLTANVLIPVHEYAQMQIVWFGAATLGYGLLIGLVESLMARNRMSKNITYLATVSAIGLLGFAVAYVLMNNNVI